MAQCKSGNPTWYPVTPVTPLPLVALVPRVHLVSLVCPGPPVPLVTSDPLVFQEPLVRYLWDPQIA